MSQEEGSDVIKFTHLVRGKYRIVNELGQGKAEFAGHVAGRLPMIYASKREPGI